VRIALHHLVRLPSAQFHQLRQRSVALHVPRGPGVPRSWKRKSSMPARTALLILFAILIYNGAIHLAPAQE
jgi:hypothetical protein